MSEEQYAIPLEDQIFNLKQRLAESQISISKLREENNRFRSLMLSTINNISTPNPIYLAQQKNTWKDLPIEQVLTFLDLFQTHAAIFQEIALEKKGKAGIKDHLNKINDSKMKAVEDFRTNSQSTQNSKPVVQNNARKRMQEEFQMTEEQSQIWMQLPKDKRSALRGMMRIVGPHFDAALKMLTSQTETAISHKK